MLLGLWASRNSPLDCFFCEVLPLPYPYLLPFVDLIVLTKYEVSLSLCENDLIYQIKLTRKAQYSGLGPINLNESLSSRIRRRRNGYEMDTWCDVMNYIHEVLNTSSLYLHMS